MDSIDVLQELVRAPGPGGQEEAVAEVFRGYLGELNLPYSTDAKGNVHVTLGDPERAKRIVVTAHLDEIAMIVRGIYTDGSLRIGSLGGLYPWKIGEGPVEILTTSGGIPGVLSFGSIHTDDPSANVQRAKEHGLDWAMCSVFTGQTVSALKHKGVRVGSRVVVAQSRRDLWFVGDFVAGYFLDDRADLLAMLLTLELLKDENIDATFLATAAEEVGGEGAQYALQSLLPEVCIALELGPLVPDAPAVLSPFPTVWVQDSYSSTSAADLDLLADTAQSLGHPLQFQAFSRGGSDASCAASRGLCARPITLGIPMENSHGFEIMHKDAPQTLAEFTVALVNRLQKE